MSATDTEIPERTLHQERITRFEEAYRQQLLDAQDGYIAIAGESFHPAAVLKAMQPVAYGAGLAEFVSSEIERIVDSACDTLPAPVAHALYSALYGAENEIQRVLQFRDATEALAVVLLALVMGECRVKNISLDSVEITIGKSTQAQKLKRRHLRSGNVADRLAVVEGVLRFCQERSIPFRVSELVPVRAVERLRLMNYVRNEVSHTQVPTEEEARELAAEMRSEFEEILLDLPELSTITACRFCGVEAGRQLTARFEDLNGHARSRHVEPRKVTSDQLLSCCQLPSQLHILFLGNDLLLPAAPYLHSRSPRGGNASDVLMFKDKKELPTPVVQFEVSGNRELVDLPVGGFEDDFAGLDRLFASGEK